MQPNPAFAATIRKGKLLNSVDIFLKLSGKSPFVKGANRYIATAQFPLAFPADNIPALTNALVIMDEVVAAGQYAIVVNPLAEAEQTAGAPIPYYSINISANKDYDMIVEPEVEFRILTVVFPNGYVATSVSLVNVAFRLAIGNRQCQIAIEDNLANEYTAPFDNPSTVFYGDVKEQGEGNGGESGYFANTFNSSVTVDNLTW